MLNIQFVLGLYNKYTDDLKRVRKYQRKFYSKDSLSRERFFWRILRYALRKFGIIQIGLELNASFDDIESEITYLLIREFKPETIIEISPSGGWSTSWILNALKDNGFGKLYSYDLVDNSTKNISLDLSENRWIFYLGDIKKNVDKLPEKIDYLFIDSDHSARFAQWYIKNVFSKLKSGTPVSVHDVFQTKEFYFPEERVILDWLRIKNIDYFSASPMKYETIFEEICKLKKTKNIWKLIHKTQTNPAIFFIFK